MKANEFNLLYKPDEKVVYTGDFGQTHIVKLRTPAWDIQSGSTLVSMEGYSGGYLVDRISKCPENKITLLELNPQQKELYVLHDGTKCPYCESNEIEGSSMDVDGNTAWQKITCLGCDKEWNDIYTLTNLVELES